MNSQCQWLFCGCNATKLVSITVLWHFISTYHPVSMSLPKYFTSVFTRDTAAPDFHLYKGPLSRRIAYCHKLSNERDIFRNSTIINSDFPSITISVLYSIQLERSFYYPHCIRRGTTVYLVITILYL